MRLSILALLPLVWCEVAHKVIEAIQESRKKYHLTELRIAEPLIEIARDRVESLAGSAELSNRTEHLWELARKHGYKPVTMGENIGKSVNKEKEGMDIFEEWIKSETHSGNIVDAPEYTHLGVYQLKTENNIYLSAVFGQLKEPSGEEKPQNTQPKKEVATGLIITSTRSAPNPNNTSKNTQKTIGNGNPAINTGLPGIPQASPSNLSGSLQPELNKMSHLEIVYAGPESISKRVPVQLVFDADPAAAKQQKQPLPGPQMPQNASAQLEAAPSNPNRGQTSILKLILVQPSRADDSKSIRR